MKNSARLLYLAIFVACAGLMGFGLYLQQVRHLEPCPLCILQRIAFILTGATALIAAVHNPGRAGKILYGALLAIFSGAGGAVAARQIWLQHLPPEKFAECGPGLSFMLNNFPLSTAFPMIFRGEGDCAKVLWRFLGLSIPEWSILWFLLFVGLGIGIARQGRKTSAA